MNSIQQGFSQAEGRKVHDRDRDEHGVAVDVLAVDVLDVYQETLELQGGVGGEGPRGVTASRRIGSKARKVKRGHQALGNGSKVAGSAWNRGIRVLCIGIEFKESPIFPGLGHIPITSY